MKSGIKNPAPGKGGGASEIDLAWQLIDLKDTPYTDGNQAERCRHGHAWTIENTYLRPSGAPEHGWRNCRACGRLVQRMVRAKKRVKHG